MHWNKMRKYIAMFLGMAVTIGTLDVPNKTFVQAAGKKPEIKIVDLKLPTGGMEEIRIYRVDDREAEKVPLMGVSNTKGRSTTQKTVFERGIGDYGYKSLSQDQQTFYNRISESLAAFEGGETNGEYKEITMDGKKSYVPFQSAFADLGLDEDQASHVWIAFAADHPGLFWLENGCAVTSDGLMPIVREAYWGDAVAATQRRERMKTEIEGEVKKYLNTAGYYELAYDKVREMDEMIISNVDFAYRSDGKTPEEADWAHTIEGVFGGEHNAVVSEGYAKAFAFLLNILDIPNVYVTGSVKSGDTTASHAWNLVSFDNGITYYCMDLTWDDMGSDNSPTGNSYMYFAMPKSKFEQKHQANTPEGTAENWLYDLPELGDDMDYTYFMQYGAYGTASEVGSDDEARGFLSRVKALRPNRLNTCAVMLDAVTLSKIREIMDLSQTRIISSEEYDMWIWADPLTDYGRGNPHPLFSLDTQKLTIDLGSETEKTLSISHVTNASGNYVRWHSDNNEVAVVKAPAYTKMEDGASVQIVAKKAGTATIRAEGSAGTMTCTVEVTGQRPAKTHTHKICAGSGCTDDSHKDVEWTALRFTDNKLYAGDTEIKYYGGGYRLPSGNYYLPDNLTFDTYEFQIVKADVNLCLNGKTLDMGGHSIVIYEDGKLSLCDCTGGGKVVCRNGNAVSIASIQAGSKRSFTMYSGSLAGDPYDLSVGDHESTEVRLLGGNVEKIKMKLLSKYGSSSLDTSVSIGQPVAAGTKIAVDYYWGDDDGELPNVPVIKGTSGYALTEAGLSNVDITVIASGYTDTVFEKKIENGVLVLHRHKLTLRNAVPATCEAAGTGEYYECGGKNGCGKMFSDAAGNTEIMQIPVGNPATGHRYGDWVSNGDGTHTHICQNDASHQQTESCSGGVATAEEQAVCSACGGRYGELLKPGENVGKFDKDVQTDGKAPDTQISTPADQLADLLLTSEEKKQLADGTDIRIVLEVKDATDSVSVSDKVLVEAELADDNTAKGFALGQYLDISLFKIIGENRSAISETNGKIAVTINIPDRLKNTDSKKTRTFAVIRVHDGSAEFLADTDDSADTITIETDRFSTYAIVYQDASNGGGGGGNTGGGNAGGTSGTGNSNGNTSGTIGGNTSGGSTDGTSGAGNTGGGNTGGTSGTSGAGNSSGKNTSENKRDNDNGSKADQHNNSEKKDMGSDTSKDDEPKTGDVTPLEMYATLAMIAGLSYLLLYFTDKEKGMTEEKKKELVGKLVRWAKGGGRFKKCLAMAAIVVLLVYYHSIGRKARVKWEEIYGE